MRKIKYFFSGLSLNKKVFFTILFVKVQILLFIIAVFYIFPFNTEYFYSNFHYPIHSPLTLQSAFMTWDAQHYLFLSQQGYHSGNVSIAFSPLFPFMIYLGTLLMRSSFWSGIILSNIFSFFAFLLFYGYVKRQSSEKIAYASLIAFLAFPTSFYFSLIYTESLFFLLVMIFFWALYERNLWIAGAMGFFITLTRLIGAALILPFITSYILEYNVHSLSDEVVAVLKTLLQKKTLFVLTPLFGFGATMLFMYISTGNFFAQFDALQNFVSHHSVFSVFDPIVFLHELFIFPLVLHGYTNSLLDRVFFLCFLVFLPFLFKRVSLPLFVYAVVFGVVPVLSGSFMSYTRYLLVVFPIFIVLGKMSQEKKYQKYSFIVLFAFLMLQALFLIMQSLNYWVS